MIETFSAVFVASLIGSGHCAAMCGGLAACYGCSAKPLASYHVGRMFSYVALGAIAGAIGSGVDQAAELAGLQHVAVYLSGAILLITGIALLGGSLLKRSGSWLSPNASKIFSRLLQSPLMRSFGPSTRSFVVGLLSAGLPCGWLWAFGLVAAGSGSAVSGMLIMLAFWAGTVPALTAVGGVVSYFRGRLRPIAPTVTGVLLIAAGLFALVHHVGKLPTAAASASLEEGVGAHSSSERGMSCH